MSCVNETCHTDTDSAALTGPLQSWASACNTLQHPLPSSEVQSAEKAVAATPLIGEGTVTATYTTTGPAMTKSTASQSTTSSGSAAAAATSSHAAGGGKDSGDGSLVNLENAAARERARSLLGLTVGIVAGVVWF